MSIAILQAEIIAEQMEELIGGLHGRTGYCNNMGCGRWCLELYPGEHGPLVFLMGNEAFVRRYPKPFPPHIADREDSYKCYTFPEFMEFFREHS